MKQRWVCSVCGYVHRGAAPPLNCPSCGAPFTSFQPQGAGPEQRLKQIAIADERPPGHRYVIIGNSAAGRSAARAIRFLDPDGVITVISEESSPMYTRPLLPDFIGGYDREDFLDSNQAYQTEDLELLLGDMAVAVDPEARVVTTELGHHVHYDALLIATGSRPLQVPWEGAEAAGIAYFRTFEDAERIEALVRSTEQAVVVGGGLLGLEFVRCFHAAGLPITHLVREGFPGYPALDPEAGEIIAAALAEMGVNVIVGDEVERFSADDGGRVAMVHTKGGRDLPADLVGVAIGVRPRLELAESAGLEVDRGILVDDHFRTSRPGIYAAGDVAQALDYVLGERRVLTSWRNSEEHGEFAGAAMAGSDRAYPGGLPANYQMAAGLPFCSLGIGNPPPDSGYEVEIIADPAARTFRKLVRRDGRLVGAVLLGDLAMAPEVEAALRPPITPDAAVAPVTTNTDTEERPSTMRKMTESFAKDAFAGESQAHMKYLNFAKKADEEGHANTARLFRAASFSEQVHASNHLDVLGGNGATLENLGAATGGEGFEIDEMYPAYIAVAEQQGEEDAKTSFHDAYEAEKVHHELYARAKSAIEAGGDLEVAAIWVCPVCGFTMENDPPGKCPICRTPKAEFHEF